MGAHCLTKVDITMNQVSFPTLGEVIKFAYEAFGLLPRKNDSSEQLDETRKKTIQRALQRLSGEEGELNERIGELIVTLSSMMPECVPIRTRLALGDIFFDIFEIYRKTLREEGTFLSKAETVKWLLLDRLALVLPISVIRNSQEHYLAIDELQSPDDLNWFLPDLDGSKWIWPLEKVMRWAYQITETSIHSFHSTDASATLEDSDRYLQSAKKWLAGEHVPSWASLSRNFNHGFDKLKTDCPDQSIIKLPDVKRQSILTMLFISRISTFLLKEVRLKFGDAVLIDFCARYKAVDVCVKEDARRIKQQVEQEIKYWPAPKELWHIKWKEISTRYWQGHQLNTNRITQKSRSGEMPEEVARITLQVLGSLAILIYDWGNVYPVQNIAPPGFAEAILDGFDLKEDKHLSLDMVDSFQCRLQKEGLENTLSWLGHWLKGIVFYRQMQFDEAFDFMCEAFEAAKYSAGRNQYLLVNQFIELAAKCEKKQAFKKGVEWATYLGLKVRWLRDKEQSPENLEFASSVLKIARYDV